MSELRKTPLLELKEKLNTDVVQKKFREMLGKKAAGFITSITSVVQNSAQLQKADPNSIILAAAQAASLDLPINTNLGLSAIIPYENRSGCVATFQIMRDGWVELCLRTGQFEYIVNELVYEGELIERNRFTDTFIFDETKRTGNTIIGYMAAFKLVNGYGKTMYMTKEEVDAHAKKYSKSFGKNFGSWHDMYDAMALKTVLKRLLKKYAPKSIEMTRAIEGDQAAFVGNMDEAKAVYVDNMEEATEVTEEDIAKTKDAIDKATLAMQQAKQNVDVETGELFPEYEQ